MLPFTDPFQSGELFLTPRSRGQGFSSHLNNDLAVAPLSLATPGILAL